ncbi:hypothetical protein [Spirosoma pollinicola]|uniref:Uncharacterized protein n=1 Tax=Spirosoma pollinicola TaxID=2057025 RepID=A0A2K8ZB11_9BACT|nr:hypothetical protein [Spirosoma pollinicola]AUD07020.1 hypothetical protein CWM47_37485 [Spirosoma pollinicola]
MNDAQYALLQSMVESFAEGKEKALRQIKENPNESEQVQKLLETRCEGEAMAYRQVLSLLDTVKNGLFK